MTAHTLTDRRGGWLTGDFASALLTTKDSEVAIKHYKRGDTEPWHVHLEATEITIVVKGCVHMCDKFFYENDIVVIPPGEGTSFLANEDSITVVIKSPSLPRDKYIRDSNGCLVQA